MFMIYNVSYFPFSGCRGCWWLARLRYRVKFLCSQNGIKKIQYCAICFVYINCLHLPLLIGYSLWSIHWPIFSVSLRKVNTVFILKDCTRSEELLLVILICHTQQFYQLLFQLHVQMFAFWAQSILMQVSLGEVDLFYKRSS